MSKITNDGLTRSGTGCAIGGLSCRPTHMATVGVKKIMVFSDYITPVGQNCYRYVILCISAIVKCYTVIVYRRVSHTMRRPL